jgi:HAD superfamily phosphatase (TIGR01668 family)
LNKYWQKFKNLFKPNLIVKDIYNIDFGKLKKQGRKEEGFKLCLTSNSYHPLKVKYFGETLGVPAVYLGFKPFPFVFRRSLKTLNAEPENTAMIGDQLFMDILGANLLNIYTIYVKYLTPEGFFLRRWMRLAEDWVLKRI